MEDREGQYGTRVAREVGGGLIVPQIDPDYIAREKVRRLLDKLYALLKVEPQNFAIVGPTGSGKSTLADQIAAERESPTFIGNAYAWRSSDEVFGRELIDPERGIYYEPSQFVRAIETPGSTVIINDLVLMQNKSIQNGLNDLLDPSKRSASVDQIMHGLGRPIRVAPEVLIICTWNEGAGYTGNIKLSDNMWNRFQNRLFLDYPSSEVQIEACIRKTGVTYEQASRLVKFAEKMRSLDDPVQISLRGLLQASRFMTLGLNIHDSILYTTIGGLDVERQTKALQALEMLYTEAEKREVALEEKYPNYQSWNERDPDWKPPEQEPRTDTGVTKDGRDLFEEDDEERF
jgi:RecA/RadA recombinase